MRWFMHSAVTFMHVGSVAAFSLSVPVGTPTKPRQMAVPEPTPVMMAMPESVSMFAVVPLLIADSDSALEQLQAFQQSHAFLISIMVAIATRLIILT